MMMRREEKGQEEGDDDHDVVCIVDDVGTIMVVGLTQMAGRDGVKTLLQHIRVPTPTTKAEAVKMFTCSNTVKGRETIELETPQLVKMAKIPCFAAVMITA